MLRPTGQDELLGFSVEHEVRFDHIGILEHLCIEFFIEDCVEKGELLRSIEPHEVVLGF